MLRTIAAEDGTACSREIVSTHPDGTEFMPEELSVQLGTPEGERIYKALERLLRSVRQDGAGNV